MYLDKDKKYIHSSPPCHAYFFRGGTVGKLHEIECALSPMGAYYRARLVWAGDYADDDMYLPAFLAPAFTPASIQRAAEIVANREECGESKSLNLYNVIHESGAEQTVLVKCIADSETILRYVVNHTLKLFVDKDMCPHIEPLPLLTAEVCTQSANVDANFSINRSS